MRCAKCGAENPAVKRFCGDCGAALANRCAQCGADNPPEKKFCGDCGTALGGATLASTVRAEPDLSAIRWGRVSDDGPGHYNPDRSEGPWGRAAKPLARRCRAEPRTSTLSEGVLRLPATRRDANQVTRSRRHTGRPRPISRPWSRTGENPPYGILGGTMETSASFEARLAPLLYPTDCRIPERIASDHF